LSERISLPAGDGEYIERLNIALSSNYRRPFGGRQPVIYSRVMEVAIATASVLSSMYSAKRSDSLQTAGLSNLRHNLQSR
jgi:hypothetical protein